MKWGELYGTVDSYHKGFFDLIKEIRENLPVKLIVELIAEERLRLMEGFSEERCPYAWPVWQVLLLHWKN